MVHYKLSSARKAVQDVAQVSSVCKKRVGISFGKKKKRLQSNAHISAKQTTVAFDRVYAHLLERYPLNSIRGTGIPRCSTKAAPWP